MMPEETNLYTPHVGDIRINKNAPEAWMYCGEERGWQPDRKPSPEVCRRVPRAHLIVADDGTFTYWRRRGWGGPRR